MPDLKSYQNLGKLISGPLKRPNDFFRARRRFYTPEFPAPFYPSETECTWKFRLPAGTEIGDVTLTCDHFDLAGNFFDDCKGGDYLQVHSTFTFQSITKRL